MDWMAGTTIATVLLALATFASVFATYQIIIDTHKRSKIKKKRKELRDQEEAYSKFMGLETSTGFVFQHRSQRGATESFATYSAESVEKVHDVWLSVTLQNAYEAEREYYRHIRYFWEVMGLIQTRFENTKELMDLIDNVVHIQTEFHNKYINSALPKGLTMEELEAWAKKIDDNFIFFDEEKLGPALRRIRNISEIRSIKVETNLAKWKRR